MEEKNWGIQRLEVEVPISVIVSEEETIKKKKKTGERRYLQKEWREIPLN